MGLFENTLEKERISDVSLLVAHEVPFSLCRRGTETLETKEEQIHLKSFLQFPLLTIESS